MEEARAETHAGLALDPTFTVGNFRLGAESDNPVFREATRTQCGHHAQGRACRKDEYGTCVGLRPRNGLNLAGHDL